MMEYVDFDINIEFRDRLITGILSSPIIYIPHYHYSYIDKTIEDVITKLDIRKIVEYFGENIFSNDEICYSGRKIDYSTKEIKKDISKGSTVKGVLKKLIINDGDEVLEDERIIIIRNAYMYFGDSEIVWLLQSFVEKYEQCKTDITIILISTESPDLLPEQIRDLVTIIDIPQPTELDIRRYLDKKLRTSKQFEHSDEELRIELTRTLMGLGRYEIGQIVNSTFPKTGGYLTEKTVEYALQEKKGIVKKTGIIEVVDTDISFKDVGGLENLQDDLKRKSELFRNLNVVVNAGIPYPKGILIIGMPGCGKSLIAKSVANEFGVSLLRLDVNRLMGQYVGQSEANLRKALQTAEAAHPCVLWIDEIEKAFAGANGEGGSSNDIVMRLMGHFLTWMQERKTAVYIVATANDVMRPEFMRKGRFDEVYFVDFPKYGERASILAKIISRYKKSNYQKYFEFDEIDIENIAKEMHANNQDKFGFSGSEIESVVNMVVENKLVSYLSLDPNDRKPQKINSEDFHNVIKKMKDNVLAATVTKDKKDEKEKTPIDRIREISIKYKLKSASK